MHRSCLRLTFLAQGFAAVLLAICFAARAQSPAETTPPEHKRTDPQQANPPEQGASKQREPTAAEISAKETVASALLRNFGFEEYQFRSAAEAMAADKYDYRPAPGSYGGVYPGYGPQELRTFGEQVKHVACSNFAFAAELDGAKPPPHCDTGGPSPAKTRDELIVYLHDSFKALKKSLRAITKENMFQPIEGPYAGPNTRLGLATVSIWHVADHYGQLVLYMRLNGIVPPASRPNPPEIKD
jgi:DinB superfamily